MKLAKDFLERFKNLTPPDDALKKAVINALYTATKISVKPKDVSISNGIAFIRCSSIAKSTIRLGRAKVLEEVFQTLPKARTLIRDVR